jgi:tRNA pseudouridine38-40 synthase
LRNLKFTIQYDGTDYVGWQRQPNGVSIQELIEDALAPIEGGAVTLHGAGRTDAGVHALGQVASATLSSQLAPETLARALNAVLPPAVRILAADEMPSSFHARFSAKTKAYEYRIVNAPVVSPFRYRYAWHIPYTLHVEAMQRGVIPLRGRHDFAAFQGAGSSVASTERTILSFDIIEDWGADGSLVMRVTGDGFLRHMVRNMVGTLVEVGAGRREAADVKAILDSRDRSRAGSTAPPHGLFLTEVTY